MDGMDSSIFSLVLVPALRDVLPSSGIAATTANVATLAACCSRFSWGDGAWRWFGGRSPTGLAALGR